MLHIRLVDLKVSQVWYSTLLVTCPVTSVKLQIANYFLLTANPNEISSTIIGFSSQQQVICNLQFNTCNWTRDQQCTVHVCIHQFINMPNVMLHMVLLSISEQCWFEKKHWWCTLHAHQTWRWTAL